MIDASEVFNPADFVSHKFVISFKNLTTRTETTSKDVITLQEFSDKTITLELPRASCNMTHGCMFVIYKDLGENKLEPLFGATGKIKEIEKMDDERLRATIYMVQYDEKSWISFKNIFNKRQNEILEFFKNVKGYGI